MLWDVRTNSRQTKGSLPGPYAWSRSIAPLVSMFLCSSEDCEHREQDTSLIWLSFRRAWRD
jgi:hypothetical protein